MAAGASSVTPVDRVGGAEVLGLSVSQPAKSRPVAAAVRKARAGRNRRAVGERLLASHALMAVVSIILAAFLALILPHRRDAVSFPRAYGDSIALGGPVRFPALGCDAEPGWTVEWTGRTPNISTRLERRFLKPA